MRDYRIWGALLRISAGVVWLFEAYPQVTASNSYLSRDFAAAVQDMARANPWRFYQQFLSSVVLTHVPVFSYVTLVANVLIGICLVLGLLTPYATIAALILNVNYALASGWMDRANYPLNGLLIVCEIAVLSIGAGKIAGVDALLSGGPARRRSRRF